MDDSFAFFLQNFGAPRAKRAVEPDYAVQYRGRLPAKLLEYWAEHGFAGYGDGVFWIVDPGEYEDVLDRWLEATPFKDEDDYHVVARTAFGALFVWGKKSGMRLQINAPHGLIFPDRDAAKRVRDTSEDFALQIFFECLTRESVDFADEQGKPLFKRTLKKLGPLENDEVYGFEPALGLGGKASLAGLRKLKIAPHLEILGGLGPPKIMENPLLP